MASLALAESQVKLHERTLELLDRGVSSPQEGLRSEAGGA